MTAANDQRIKVVEILEATTGGTRRHLSDLVTRIDKDRFDVSVICSTLRDPAFADDVQNMRALGVTVVEIPMLRKICPMNDPIAFWRIWRYLVAEKPDIVHTHSSKAGFLGRLAAKLTRTRLVVHTPHLFAFEMEASDILKAFFFRLEQFASRMTDMTICVSPCEKETALRLGLVSPKDCSVVLNGVDIPDASVSERNRAQKRKELGLAEDDIVIGSIGRFTRQKGYDYFLAAAKLLADKLPGARFVLIGNGELRGEIERTIKESGIANRCIAVSAHDDFSQYYPIFDIFVLTSLWEGMPYAMLEAMSIGRAVAAFKTGGIADVITDHKDGLLVSPRNTEELASAISTLATEPQKREDLGQAARLLISSEYKVETMVHRTEDLYVQGLQV